MPNFITSIPPSTAEGNEQSDTPSTMSADSPAHYQIMRDGSHPSDMPATDLVPPNLPPQVAGAYSLVMPSPRTTVEIDGLKYVLVDTVAAKGTDDVDNGSDRKHTSAIFSGGVVVDDGEAKVVPDDPPTQKESRMAALSYDRALAFLNCNETMTDDDIVEHVDSKASNFSVLHSFKFTSRRRLTIYSLQISSYPGIVDFAHQAVKSIAEARKSKALLNWLDTGILQDSESTIPQDEHLPKIKSPFAWRVLYGDLSYPPQSIGQGTNNNT